MINENIAQYKTIQQVKTAYNSDISNKSFLVGSNVLQVQDRHTKVYYYLVENMGGWSDMGVTSLTDYFTDKEIE